MLRHHYQDPTTTKCKKKVGSSSTSRVLHQTREVILVLVSILLIFLFVYSEVAILLPDVPHLFKHASNKMNCIHVAEEADGEYVVDINYSSLSHDFPEEITRNRQESAPVYQNLYHQNTVGSRIKVTESLREKPIIFDIYRDALYSLSGAVELNGLDDEYSVQQSHRLSLYQGNRKLHKSYQQTPIIPSSSTKYDVSIITQTSYERLFYFPYLLQRWKGPIHAAIFIKDNEKQYFTQFIRNTPLSNRLHLIIYEVLPMEQSTHQCIVYYHELEPIPVNEVVYNSSIVYGNRTIDGLQRRFQRICNDNSEAIYPINRLRNLAIQSIETTHFLVIDMDMWPIETVYDDMLNLPSSILRNEHLIMILPAFSLKASSLKNCSSFQDCVEKVIPLLPRNKTELIDCIEHDQCSTFRPESFTHNYLTDDWYTLQPTTRFLFKQCFNHVFQEPYVMARRSTHLPLFDERFINYGYNKVQWIEHLRWLGYQFAVMAHSFAVDIPHPPSNYANTWSKLWEVKNNPNITMRIVYRRFLTELRSRTNDDSTVFVCHRYANRYTKNIAINHQDMKDRKIRVDEAKKRMKEEMEANKTIQQQQQQQQGIDPELSKVISDDELEEIRSPIKKKSSSNRFVIKGGTDTSKKKRRIVFRLKGQE